MKIKNYEELKEITQVCAKENAIKTADFCGGLYNRYV